MKRKEIFFLAGLLGLVLLSSCSRLGEAGPEDWPMFRKDHGQAAKTNLSLRINTLTPSWIFQSPQLPKPAWYGPAIWDSYSKSDILPSMRNYDLVFQPIVIKDRLFYGSSSDDAIHCLDTKTGKELWQYTADGPIRIAPFYQDEKLYFGADDGFAYCINANNGKMIWRFSPERNEHLVLCDGKMISMWPIRSGVTVREGIAYFAASLFPWKSSYLCAVDAKTGVPGKPGTFIKTFETCTFEGALLAGKEYLVQPQGRVAPLFFNRQTGEKAGVLPGSGGAFVMLTEEDHILHQSGSRKPILSETGFQEGKGKNFVSFERGKALIVSGDTAFVLTDKTLAAHNRKDGKPIWNTETFFSIAMVMSGQNLILGGVDKIEAYNAKDGSLTWSTKVEGKAHGLVVADKALFVSTDEGKIYCFREGTIELTPIAEDKAYTNDIQRSATLVYQKKTRESDENRMKGKYLPTLGPIVRFVNQEEAVVQWETEEPTISTLVFNRDGKEERLGATEMLTSHSVHLKGLRKERYYSYHIEALKDDKLQNTDEYDLDNFFNYSVPQIQTINESTQNPEKALEAKQILKKSGFDTGIALVYGLEEGNLVYELARLSKMKIIGVDTDPEKVKAIRNRFQEWGIYGERISLYTIPQFEALPFPGDLFNLIVSESGNKDQFFMDEIIRLMRPFGGLALFSDKNINGLEEWFSQASNQAQVTHNITVQYKDNGWLKLEKKPLDGAGKWTHLYGSPNNSAFGGEKFWGVNDNSDFEVQWMGRPGPRYQADRSGRKTGPLSVNGRLFLEGLNRIVAMDAFNGKILWSCEIPGFNRFNMPRDCSNWCADNKNIYAVVNNRCLVIDQATGQLKNHLKVLPPKKNKWKNDWEYIGNYDSFLLGSSTRQGASYDLFSGGWGWYDGREGNQTYKICSDNIFALSKSNFKPLWQYENGVILNTSITIADSTVFFVENRNKKIKNMDSRRIGHADLWKDLYLVALHIKTGQKQFEKPLAIEPGIPVFFMAHSEKTLILVSSHKWHFHVYAQDASTGAHKWTQKIKWLKDNHGGHMSRPAIVNGKVYIRPGVLDLKTGAIQEERMPGGGCGTYACSENAVFFRSGDVTMWNNETEQTTGWKRLRPDCWLSTIPACGMLLSPEGGGGCSCGGWLETSMGLAPITRGPLAFASNGITHFKDNLSIQIIKKPGVKGIIRYTTDGSLPNAKSPEYSSSIILNGSTTLRASLFDEKGRRVSTISKSYTRLFPQPHIKPQLKLTAEGRWVELKKEGETGTIYYTTDESDPSPTSNKYDTPFSISKTQKVKARTFWKMKNGKWKKSQQTELLIKVPVMQKAATPCLFQGVSFKFFPLKESYRKLPDLSSLNATKEGVTDDISLKPSPQESSYALDFNGQIEVPQDGLYRFYLVSDDGAILWINGQKLINDDGAHGPREKNGVIALQKGNHSFRVTYYQGGGGATLKLLWESFGLSKQPIPSTSFFH